MAFEIFGFKIGKIEDEVKEAISGNICRCTGYGRVFAAVEATIRSRNDVK